MKMNDYIPNGYIVLARKIRRSSLWLSLKATHRVVMIELLLQAAYQDCEVVRNGEIIKLERGQVATSYQHLVDDIGDKEITVKVVRNAIDKLERHGFLAKDKAVSRAKKGLLLTIVNYGVYQDAENYKGKATDKGTGDKGAEQGQSEGKAGAINKNINKDKNEEEERKDINPYRVLEENRFPFMTPILKDKVDSLVEDFGIDEFVEAVTESVVRGKRNLPYVTRILENWRLEGKGKQESKEDRLSFIDDL